MPIKNKCRVFYDLPGILFFVFENFFEKFLIYPRKTLARYAAS